MGCCITRNRIIYDFPYEEIDEFNKLKTEINQILNNKDKINHTDNNELLELINKISIKIATCQEVIENLKIKRRTNPQLINETIEGVNTNIKELKEYNYFLNNKVKENKNEINVKIIKEEINIKETKDIKNGQNLKTKNNVSLNPIKPIYYKKCIEKNKNCRSYNKIIKPRKRYLTDSNCNFNDSSKFNKNENLYDNNLTSVYNEENNVKIQKKIN